MVNYSNSPVISHVIGVCVFKACACACVLVYNLAVGGCFMHYAQVNMVKLMLLLVKSTLPLCMT